MLTHQVDCLAMINADLQSRFVQKNVLQCSLQSIDRSKRVLTHQVDCLAMINADLQSRFVQKNVFL